MEMDHASTPPEKLAELAEGRAFRLLLEAHAQEAITRVLRRALWVLTAAVLVGGWLGWSKYTSWDATVAEADRKLASLEGFDAKLKEAEEKIAKAERLAESSQSLIVGVQSGVATSAGLLQRQADSLREAVGQAEATRADAEAAHADRKAVATHKAQVAEDAATVHQATELLDKAADLHKQVERLWGQVKDLNDIQLQLAKARMFQLVLLTTHRAKTIEIRDPAAPGAPRYEMVFTSSDLRGHKSPEDPTVWTIAVSVEVRPPGGAPFTRTLQLEDSAKANDFFCLQGTPFEIMLDFRYARLGQMDFVALRVRPGDRCAPPSTRAERS
jgi:hypothetical protein